jgi:isoquinoline 1-oxidoreductase beta subunit
VPVILAEEMDADWSRVRIENSPIEPDLYGLGPSMGTYGSRTIRGYFPSLRRVGGQIHKVLLQNTARERLGPVRHRHQRAEYALRHDHTISSS